MPLTTFIGREKEILEIVQLIQSARLVTLLGPPGTGKTRLALEVGRKLALSSEAVGMFPEGVSFVPLASIRDPDLVGPVIGQTLGVREMPHRSFVESLVDHLSHRRMLLVLDNFEHVIEGAQLVSQLLASCPHLSVLATSRELLRLSGEHQCVVPPLSVLRGPAPFDDVARSEAIRLYVERATAVHSSFRLTDQNAPAVIEICLRLDGLPLAIELAAARIRLFPPQAFLGRLSRPLTLLTGGARDLPARQQTLRSSIEWSFRLLTKDEQRLFARLSVFSAGWTLDAAELICAGEGELDVLARMASLVEKSLVQQEEMPGDQPRLNMLETIRQFAEEQLEAGSDEARAVRHRHAEYYLKIAC
ncbi:MAG: AAA family ATPase, partial [Candidatus Dormibacteraeota bacterium]|nr:AAA family ATPase [Candidatus Dormibacteraeota bacterium]